MDPVWNKPVNEIGGAQDPLGMSRVSDRILYELLSGITTQTQRARYYSFYIWVIDYISRKSNAVNLAQFRSLFYDIERLYMLSCLAHQLDDSSAKRDHSSITGSLRGNREWNDSEENISLEFNFFGDKLGGYGQYYQGSLSKLGLVAITEDHKFECPTEKGKIISDSIGGHIQESGLIKAIEKKNISKKELQRIGNSICLCKLRDRESADRATLRKLFFGDLQDLDSKTVQRRQTLGLILFLVDICDKKGVSIDDQLFLDACYFKQIIIKNKINKISFPKQFEETVDIWKIFRAHDYISLGAECILMIFLNNLEKRSQTGMKLDNFIKLVTSEEVIRSFFKQNKIASSTYDPTRISFQDVINAIGKNFDISSFSVNPIDNGKLFDLEVSLSSVNSEYHANSIIDEELGAEKDLIQIMSATLTLLFYVYMRFNWYQKKDNVTWKLICAVTKSDISPARFISEINTERMNSSLYDFIYWFTRQYVIDQALRIYWEKNTSIWSKSHPWFHLEGEYYKFDREYIALYRNTRFQSVLSILNDLGFLKIGEKSIELSADGKNIIEKVIGENI